VPARPSSSTRPDLIERIWAKRFSHYRPRDLLELLRTPPGRLRLRRGLLFLFWPVTSRLARLHRLTLARKVRVVAVVGSLGKTTAARAIAAALDVAPRHRLSANSLHGVSTAILRLRPSDRRTVVEVGIDGKRQMAPMARTVRPSIAVVTSIASEHNRSLGTLEETRHEKAHMVRSLPASGIAVLNGDDPNVLWMAGQTRARVVTFGFGAANQVRASAAEVDWPRGMRFRLQAGGEERDVSIRLFGRHMVYAALAAVAVSLEEGVPLDRTLQRLKTLTPTPGRMDPRTLPNGAVLLLDDHKSALETIHAALDFLEQIPAIRKIVVLGQINEPPGPQGPLYRELGRRIAGIAQLAVFVDSYWEYKGGVNQAGMPRERYFDGGQGIAGALEILRRELHEGDVVLIKGRNNQKLERIALGLAGKNVECRLLACGLRRIQCQDCPMLETVAGQPRVR
jgi:UDP-N-acetylmuramoyl-tripeptide--D-alanyl-D-alanine ligase